MRLLSAFLQLLIFVFIGLPVVMTIGVLVAAALADAWSWWRS